MMFQLLVVAACVASVTVGQTDAPVGDTYASATPAPVTTETLLPPNVNPTLSLTFSTKVNRRKVVKGTKRKRWPVMAGRMRRR
jgi:hypothetical protein